MSLLPALQSNEFESKVLKAGKPVLVEFGAPWCAPCNQLEPVLKDLVRDYDGQIDLYSIDVDQHPDLVMNYGVMGVPTVMLFRDGQPIHRLTGFRPKKALEKAFFADL